MEAVMGAFRQVGARGLGAPLIILMLLAMVVLVLDNCCRGGKSSLERLHVLNWAVRNKENREVFLKLLNGERRFDSVIVRYEPSLNKAIDYAVGEELVVLNNKGRIILVGKGKQFAEQIEADEGCMREEKDFFRLVGKQLTESETSKLTRG